MSDGERLLFLGDSVTAAGRDVPDPTSLGTGFVAEIAAALRARRSGEGPAVVNRGVNGNRLSDLIARLGSDCLELAPTAVTVMIGVNDTWRRFDPGLPSPLRLFERDYRTLVRTIQTRLGARILLAEPFILPVNREQWAWRRDLTARIDAVRRVAVETGAELLAVDGLLAAHGGSRPERYAPDGIHPGPRGHSLIAREWLRRY